MKKYLVNKKTKKIFNGIVPRYEESLICSEEEHVIGYITLNGKKRTKYSKTIYRPVLIHGEEEIVQHGIKNVDIMWCDPSNSFAIWSDLGIVNNLPFMNLEASSIAISDFNSTTFKLKSQSDRSHLSGYITLIYTKTDDK